MLAVLLLEVSIAPWLLFRLPTLDLLLLRMRFTSKAQMHLVY